MSIPFVAYSNDELDTKPNASPGDTFSCPRCGEAHELIQPTGEDGQPSDTLYYYRCGDKTYLGAVAGKWVVSR